MKMSDDTPLPADRGEAWSMDMPLTEVNPRLYELLTGSKPDENPPPPRYRVKINDHEVEAVITQRPATQEELDRVGNQYKVTMNLTEVVWLCGPHDEKGNHIS